jgi:hypothetical protein
MLRAQQSSPLPTPRAGESNLPLGEWDPEVREAADANSVYQVRRYVYQVRRYEVLTADDITSAVTEYADPQPPKAGGEKAARRFAVHRYVLFTSAEFETETALQDRLEELQRQYDGDLIIEVWGREMISSMLRDSGALVNNVFGPEWARVFCGFAPPPPRPDDPDSLGLVDSPVQVLNLDAIASDARAQENDQPLESGRLYGILADTLTEANFPSHAAAQRRRQAQFLQGGGDSAGAFPVMFGLARADFTAGATSMLGPVQHSLEALRPDLDELQAAKLDVLAAAQSWYEQGSQLAVAVPALETAVAAADPDAAFLACIILEQALVDGWFDLDPPHSLVTPDGNTTDLLTRLRQSANGLSCNDVVIRARLACALGARGRETSPRRRLAQILNSDWSVTP